MTALQGAARMVLQTGAHPAQIKDTVTSKCTHVRYSVADPNYLHSARRLHNRRFACTGRWQSAIHYCSWYTNRYRARQSAWTASLEKLNLRVILYAKIPSPRNFRDRKQMLLEPNTNMLY